MPRDKRWHWLSPWMRRRSRAAEKDDDEEDEEGEDEDSEDADEDEGGADDVGAPLKSRVSGRWSRYTCSTERRLSSARPGDCECSGEEKDEAEEADDAPSPSPSPSPS